MDLHISEEDLEDNSDKCNFWTCLYASCCPVLFATKLRTFT